MGFRRNNFYQFRFNSEIHSYQKDKENLKLFSNGSTPNRLTRNDLTSGHFNIKGGVNKQIGSCIAKFGKEAELYEP